MDLLKHIVINYRGGETLQGTIDILEIFRGRADAAKCQEHILSIPPYQMPVSLLLAAQILGDQRPGRHITCMNLCDSGCSCPIGTLCEQGGPWCCP